MKCKGSFACSSFKWLLPERAASYHNKNRQSITLLPDALKTAELLPSLNKPDADYRHFELY